MLLFPLQLLFALSLNDDQVRYNNFNLPHLYDASSKLTVEEVSKQRFEPGPNQFSYGYLDGIRWFKLTLTNTSKNHDFILSFTEPLWEEFDLYSFEDEGWKISHAGLSIPLKQREISDSSPAFRIHVLQGESKTFYVRGQTLSGQIGAFEVFTQKEYFNPSRFGLSDFYLFFIMFLVIIAFFNIYLFVARQEKIYILYILYVFSMIIWLSVKSGLYLTLEIDGWNHGLHATGTLIVLFLTLFSSEFLQLKQRLPLMYTVFNVFALLFLFLGLAISLDVPHASLSFNLISSVFFALLLFISIKVWREGHVQTRYYLVALFIYMPTMGMLTLSFNGLITNNDLTRYAFLFGSFAEVIFFNSLMISHYHMIFMERIRIKNELIKVKEEREGLLEDEIKERIKELEEMNKILLSQTHELERTQEHLRIEATTDSLSSLYNRRYILGVADRLFDSAVRYGHNLSTIMIDIDDFKKINDTYGHAMGDEVIVRCAKILKKNVRGADILARYGGEEFLILIPNTPNDEVLDLANRIRKNIEKEKVSYRNEEPLGFTMSLGITHLQENDLNIEQLIDRADRALYISKSKGKNCVEIL